MRAQRSIRLGLALAFVTACFEAPGFAEVPNDADSTSSFGYGRSGTYLSISGMFVSERWAESLKDAGAEDTHGFNLRAGVRANEWVSAEIELGVTGDFFPDERQDFSDVSASLNTRIYPLQGRVQPYVLGGLGIVSTVVRHRDRNTNVRQSNADWAIRTGAGIDLYYTNHVAVSAEATHVWTAGDVKDIDHVSLGIGLMYRF